MINHLTLRRNTVRPPGLEVVGILILILAVAGPVRAARWALDSPDGTIRMTIRLEAVGGRAGYPADTPRLYYQVEHGTPEARRLVVPPSPLGLIFDEADFLDGLRFASAEGPKPIAVHYTLRHGKRRQCRNEGRSLTLNFKNRHGHLLALDLRAFPDGVAFRYRLPGDDATPLALVQEMTGFAMPEGVRLWMHPNDTPTTYAPAYETYFVNEAPVDTVSPTGKGWALPVLFRTADKRHWGLITEANLGPNYFGARLTSRAAEGVFHIRLPDPAEGHGYGAAPPVGRRPWTLPWRVIVLGDSPGDIIESTLVTDVSDPSKLEKTDWIRPGRVAWSWWSDQASPRDCVKQKRFVDFAAEMGWEYVLVDANWTIMDRGTIHDLIRHAKAKGVGVLLWYNSGGPHNVVTEKPRGNMFFRPVRRFEFNMLRQWGVKGVKVDFFQSDWPAIIKLYHDILEDAAEFQIMVNFHGCTLPRGWTRTYPHLMAMEAVRGEECYLFDKAFPERAPQQNTITPFTRNAVGPMDYTPVAFSRARYPHRTTYAHELALSVLFESGWVHFADDPDVYRRQPGAIRDWLKRVPVTWDDVKYLDGYPGRSVVLARRHDNWWYVAGVNGTASKRTLKVPLNALFERGRTQLTLIADGNRADQFDIAKRTLGVDETVEVPCLPYGGFAARLSPTR